MSDRSSRPSAAFCEDYNSDANETVPETRKVANVAAARRKSGYRSSRTKDKVGPDVASDSGYSSHTAATIGSADSIPGAYPTSLMLDTASPTKRRPALVHSKTNSSHRSSEKVPTRTISRTKRRDSRHEGCDCKDCPGAGHGPPTPLETPWDVNYYPFNQRQPIRYNGPPSPGSTRHYPPGYMMEPPIIHAAQGPRPRALSTQSYGRVNRPVSYHAGIPTEELAMPIYASSYERGPPPALSAYGHPSYAPAPSYPPPGAYIPQPGPPTPRQDYPQPPPSPYERPPSRQWSSDRDRYATRPTSTYGRPVVEYDQAPFAPPVNRRPSIRDSRPVVEEYERERDEDYYRMPPPQSIPARRPSMRHSATTSSARDILRSASVDPDVAAKVTRERSRRNIPEQDSRQRRPSLASGGSGRKSTSYSNASGSAKISVESANRRRSSYYGHEKTRDLEQQQQQQRRAIEEYQENITKTTPLTADALRAARRSHRPGSDSGSHSRASSSREGSEVKTRSGSGMAQSDAGSFTMRFNTAAGVKLDFSGDLEGRTISLKPGDEGGQAELSIGGRSRSTRYLDRANPAQIEYARSGLRREIEDGPRARDSKTERSRRSSQSRSRRTVSD